MYKYATVQLYATDLCNSSMQQLYATALCNSSKPTLRLTRTAALFAHHCVSYRKVLLFHEHVPATFLAAAEDSFSQPSYVEVSSKLLFRCGRSARWRPEHWVDVSSPFSCWSWSVTTTQGLMLLLETFGRGSSSHVASSSVKYRRWKDVTGSSVRPARYWRRDGDRERDHRCSERDISSSRSVARTQLKFDRVELNGWLVLSELEVTFKRWTPVEVACN